MRTAAAAVRGGRGGLTRPVVAIVSREERGGSFSPIAWVGESCDISPILAAFSSQVGGGGVWLIPQVLKKEIAPLFVNLNRGDEAIFTVGDTTDLVTKITPSSLFFF
jgi:hypothetical protein